MFEKYQLFLAERKKSEKKGEREILALGLNTLGLSAHCQEDCTVTNLTSLHYWASFKYRHFLSAKMKLVTSQTHKIGL